MKNIILKSSVLLIGVASLFSCQKVITVNLNDAAPQLVIEANVSNLPNSCIVKLSKTVNFDEPNTFPAVSGAVIIINDNAGNSATLVESPTGIYTTSLMQTVPGRTYTINVTTGGNTYTAVSTVGNPMAIDTLTEDSISAGFSGKTFNKYVNVEFNDPPVPNGSYNYYKFVQIDSGNTSNTIFIANDRLREGELITVGLVQRDSTLYPGDSVTILMETINEDVYNYFEQFRQVVGGAGAETATPANPVSNFSGGVLGYFNACSVTSKSIVIE
jgi:hypothetical protein